MRPSCFLLAALQFAGTSAALAGQTSRVSVDSSGAQANNNSSGPSISANGRFVAFESDATNLVSGDSNSLRDVFLHDRKRGLTRRVSVDSAGAQANGHCLRTDLSANGRFIVFQSDASNLVPGDTNALSDIFLHDRKTGVTSLVSVDSAGSQALGGGCYESSVSGNGRFVAFSSFATNLVPGDSNETYDIFVRDRKKGRTERVSVSSEGGQANGPSRNPVISANGRFVAFESGASNLVEGDTNTFSDIFVHDRKKGRTRRVSLDSGGNQAIDGPSFSPSISGSGRLVAFDSEASNLTPGDTNLKSDVFLHDRKSGKTRCVSAGSNGESHSPSVSRTGRFVAFHSSATNLLPGLNGWRQILVHDRKTGRIRHASVDSEGVQADEGASIFPVISRRGRVVAFQSFASNLVEGDTNDAHDIFLRFRR